MAASTLQMHVYLLPNKVSMKFQRLHLCFRDLAFHWDSEYYATEPEGEKSKMTASKLQVYVSPLPDEISTKFRRLYLCFRGQAFHWDSWKYYTTELEVTKFKMAASKLQMHVSLLPDKLSTKFWRLCLCFRGLAFYWDSSHDYATKPEVKKSKMAAGIL